MKHRKILKLFFVIVSIISMCNFCYAKYIYNYEEVIIKLKRDNETPSYEITYSPKELTNTDVEVTITTNEESQQINGFTLSDDKRTSKRTVSENEEQEVLIRDLSGNYVEVKYIVDNIDKEPPEIIGCEDGGTYKAPLELTYEDDIGIKSVKIDRFDYELHAAGTRKGSECKVFIDKHPLNTVKYRYFIDNELYCTVFSPQYIITGLSENNDYEIKIEALDEFGNVLDTTFLDYEKKNYTAIPWTFDENLLTYSRELSNNCNRFGWKSNDLLH